MVTPCETSHITCRPFEHHLSSDSITPQTKPTDLCRQSTRTLLFSTPTITIDSYYLARKLIFILQSHREGWVDQGRKGLQTAVKHGTARPPQPVAYLLTYLLIRFRLISFTSGKAAVSMSKAVWRLRQ